MLAAIFVGAQTEEGGKNEIMVWGGISPDSTTAIKAFGRTADARFGIISFRYSHRFNTGDVATICPLGYLQITDRTKDVIKSGGEWISSIELETRAVAHPAIAQAAAIAIAHPKWQERPLLVAVLKAGATATREEVLEYFGGKVAKWWIPDDVVFVDKLPLTATGKISKLQLRQQFADYRFPEVAKSESR